LDLLAEDELNLVGVLLFDERVHFVVDGLEHLSRELSSAFSAMLAKDQSGTMARAGLRDRRSRDLTMIAHINRVKMRHAESDAEHLHSSRVLIACRDDVPAADSFWPANLGARAMT
jgi:hypothetical protein